MPGDRGRALVVGGTGPTGPFVVQGLRDRGWSVAMLHTGAHERSEIADDVTHIHTDPFDRDALAGALGGSTFDVAVVMYGRLRVVADVLAGTVGRFVSIGGVPALDGYGNPEDLVPAGLPVPTSEDARTIDRAQRRPGNEKALRIVETERAVFAAHPYATHLRYPNVYGPHQLLPREWLIVRRALDGRRRFILPDGGLYLCSSVYVENAAAAVLACVDHPDASAGKIYHVSDETTPTLRQMVEIVSTAVGHEFELVDLPYEFAFPTHPLMTRAGSFHRYTPPTKLVVELGYRDVVPHTEALARTARWLAAHPPERGGRVERSLQDPFDYAAEDALLAVWDAACDDLRRAVRATDPIFVDRYAPTRDDDLERRRALRARRAR